MEHLRSGYPLRRNFFYFFEKILLTKNNVYDKIKKLTLGGQAQNGRKHIIYKTGKCKSGENKKSRKIFEKPLDKEKSL